MVGALLVRGAPLLPIMDCQQDEGKISIRQKRHSAKMFPPTVQNFHHHSKKLDAHSPLKIYYLRPKIIVLNLSREYKISTLSY